MMVGRVEIQHSTNTGTRQLQYCSVWLYAEGSSAFCGAAPAWSNKSADRQDAAYVIVGKWHARLRIFNTLQSPLFFSSVGPL